MPRLVPTSDLLTASPAGLYCPAGDFHIDPWLPVRLAIVTHGHFDHARPGHQTYICAEPGVPILRRRLGPDVHILAVPCRTPHSIGTVTISFHAAGHVLGSAQVRVDGEGQTWVVTGDYKRQPDPTCAPFDIVSCDAIVTEATFGLPIYCWPDPDAVLDEMLAWWRDNRDAGRASVLFCYALGKAQRILAGLAARTNDRVFVHGAIAGLVDVYREAGVHMLPTQPVAETMKGRSFAGELVLAPESAIGTTWMRRFGTHETAFASGWMRVRGNRRRRSFDRGFELSDHADWPALLRTVRESGATRVLTSHGYAEPLARYLAERGLDARALPQRGGEGAGVRAED